MRWFCLLPALVGVTFGMAITGCSEHVREADSRVAEAPPPATVKLLNVSYDPTREFYKAYNEAFAEHWRAEHDQIVTIDQAHGGSGKQARAVIDGLDADVVTLALGLDIDQIANKKLIAPDWRERLPHNSAPYTSTIVFLVRKGNPKNIRDWDDLVQGDVALVAANPKTGGGARWNYLAAWGAVLHRELQGDWTKLNDPAAKDDVAAAQAKAKDFVGNVYRRMVVLDSGARGATNSFLKNNLGDVLLCWENEAFLTQQEFGSGEVEIVVPSISILAEPAVAVVDRNVDKHDTRAVAEAYLEWLFSARGQQLAAEYFYRPAKPELADRKALEKFSDVKLFTIADVFGDWPTAQQTHFADGAIFDQIYVPQK
jgi:sulfate/thiosulfate-binding protein